MDHWRSTHPRNAARRYLCHRRHRRKEGEVAGRSYGSTITLPAHVGEPASADQRGEAGDHRQGEEQGVGHQTAAVAAQKGIHRSRSCGKARSRVRRLCDARVNYSLPKAVPGLALRGFRNRHEDAAGTRERCLAHAERPVGHAGGASGVMNGNGESVPHRLRRNVEPRTRTGQRPCLHAPGFRFGLRRTTTETDHGPQHPTAEPVAATRTGQRTRRTAETQALGEAGFPHAPVPRLSPRTASRSRRLPFIAPCGPAVRRKCTAIIPRATDERLPGTASLRRG